MERIKHHRNKDKFGLIFSRKFFASSSFALLMALHPHLSHAQEDQNVKSEKEKEIILEVKQSGLQEFLKERKSRDFEVEGIPHMLFLNGMVKKTGNSRVELVGTADFIHNTGHDGELIRELGVPPVMNPAAPSPRLIFNFEPPNITIPDPISEYVSKFDLGKPTSAGQVGEEAIYRFEKGVLKLLPDGTVEPMPIGEIVAKANLVPSEKLLEEPTDDPEITPAPPLPYTNSLGEFTGGGPRAVGAYIIAHSGLEAWRVACGESQLGLNMVNLQGSGARGYFQWMSGTARSVDVIIGNLQSEVKGYNKMVRDGRRREFLGSSSSCPLP